MGGILINSSFVFWEKEKHSLFPAFLSLNTLKKLKAHLLGMALKELSLQVGFKIKLSWLTALWENRLPNPTIGV